MCSPACCATTFLFLAGFFNAICFVRQAGYLSQAAAAANYTAAANAAARAYGAAAAAQPSVAYATVPARYIAIHSLLDGVFIYNCYYSNSYGTDPYLGHSIGPVPTYGVTNSVELQSVNKLVGFFYKVSFCAHIINRIFLLFSCILRLRCTEVVTTGSHPIESARK